MIAIENFDIGLANQLLDQGVTSKDQTDISKNTRLHLHCWHGSDPFSKFAFKAGKYSQIQPSSLISDTSSSGLVSREIGFRILKKKIHILGNAIGIRITINDTRRTKTKTS